MWPLGDTPALDVLASQMNLVEHLIKHKANQTDFKGVRVSYMEITELLLDISTQHSFVQLKSISSKTNCDEHLNKTQIK